MRPRIFLQTCQRGFTSNSRHMPTFSMWRISYLTKKNLFFSSKQLPSQTLFLLHRDFCSLLSSQIVWGENVPRTIMVWVTFS